MREHLDFCLSLHQRFPASGAASTCWSPYSVVSALGLAAAATAGATRQELVTALRSDPGPLGRAVGAAADLPGAGDGGPELAVANTLWTRSDVPVEDAYLQQLRGWPGSAVRSAPFAEDPDGARRSINADVADTTRGLIPELLDAGSVHPNTVAALVNALYLKLAWQHPFDTAATKRRAFHAPGGRREVATMRHTRTFGYAAQHGWQVVALPLAGGAEAVVLLPDGELTAAEPDLDAARLTDLLQAPQDRRLDLYLPKFEVTGRAELQQPLGALGVRTLFTPAADFSALTSLPLRVSTIVHQAVLEADESGIEGAAATAVMMRLTSAVREPDPLVVRVDRPFLFLVRHPGTGLVYFLARVTDPS
ncbi:serpin family protein [Saccharopolyspora montiporae]|uniref:serpin family protein n=1 Tax=Saccharopolyspora montiporae TaxID=2781240 RepID=UPI00351C703C